MTSEPEEGELPFVVVLVAFILAIATFIVLLVATGG